MLDKNSSERKMFENPNNLVQSLLSMVVLFILVNNFFVNKRVSRAKRTSLNRENASKNEKAWKLMKNQNKFGQKRKTRNAVVTPLIPLTDQ